MPLRARTPIASRTPPLTMKSLYRPVRVTSRPQIVLLTIIPAIIGSKATVYDATDYCTSPRFIPETLHQELGTSGKLPPKTIVPSVLITKENAKDFYFPNSPF